MKNENKKGLSTTLKDGTTVAPNNDKMLLSR